MMIHTAIRTVVLTALKKTVTDATFFDGRPAFLEAKELPAIAVYLTDATKTEHYLDGDQWGAVLHIEVFLKADTPDSALDAWMEKEIYPVMQDIPELMGLVESLTPIGYDYRRDEEATTWGSSDFMYSITYLR